MSASFDKAGFEEALDSSLLQQSTHDQPPQKVSQFLMFAEYLVDPVRIFAPCEYHNGRQFFIFPLTRF